MKTSQTGVENNVDSQTEVVRFLSEPASYDLAAADVVCIETHGARVFLAGDFAYKIKRNVRFDYMDFSTLALRRAACERELEINRTYAPQLYCNVVAITRANDGGLAFDGAGPVVEWAVRMRRFSQAKLLGAIAGTGPIDPALCEAIGDLLVHHHHDAPPHPGAPAGDRLNKIISGVTAALDGAAGILGRDGTDQFGERIRSEHDAVKDLISERAAAGCVRRCHGDLHLDNIVVLDDGPVIFDAIEFSDDIATIDVLYDLAFLLMDLCHADQQPAANRLFNRYISSDGTTAMLDGLATLPLYQALRAGIRAMVLAQRYDQSRKQDVARRARAYLATALEILQPLPPRLIAVGGYSGTGKTTQARALAPLVGRLPGAMHVRSDLERKALFGVAETDRLPTEAYTAEASAAVYRRMLEKAERVLAAGCSVIVDAVFAREEERTAVAAIARQREVRFDGIWLQASSGLMMRRVAARSGDASDATPQVVREQLQRDPGRIAWHIIDSEGTPDAVLGRMKALPELRLNAGR